MDKLETSLELLDCFNPAICKFAMKCILKRGFCVTMHCENYLDF